MFNSLESYFFVALLLTAILGTTAFADTSVPTPDPLSQMRAEHVMISTDDYDATMQWYQEKLGFKIKQEWAVPEFPGVQLAYIELNGFVIEVVETPTAFQEKKIPADLGASLSDRGYGHLAFLVADIDAVATELQRRGVKLVVPPTSFTDAGRRLIFIQDNNGNYIEFLTPLSAYRAPN